MLKIQTKLFSTSTIRLVAVSKNAAASKGKAKSQGYSKASSNYVKPTSKRITSTTLYKNWVDTMHTARLNKNAKEVTLPIFNSIKIDQSINKVCDFSTNQLKCLHHLGSFKKNQYRELFSKPSSLIRRESIGKLIQNISNSNGNNSNRIIITGEPGVGKSTLLAQLHAYAVESKYLIINIPYPELFLNGRNDFFWDENLKYYVQPMYLKKLLSKILKANEHQLLSAISLQRDYKFSFTTLTGVQEIVLQKDNHTLLDLLKCKVNPSLRGIQFKIFVDEIYSQIEIPVLFTVDNVSRLLTSSYTAYRDTENRLIPTLKFQIASTIMDIASGKIPFKNLQSSFVAAISSVDRTNRTLPVGLNKLEEDIYIRQYHYDPVYANLLKQGDVKEFHLSKMNKDEVKRLLDYYSQCDILSIRDTQDKDTEKLVDEKFFISGNGNPRELLKSITLAYR